MKICFFALIPFAMALCCCQASNGTSYITKESVIVMPPGPKSVPIRPGFIGFSYEKSFLSRHFFSESNRALVRLFRNLGYGVLRIGGNSVDRTSWGGKGAAGSGSKDDKTTTGDIDELAGFLRATGWRVIYGLNGKTSPYEKNADEAFYAASRLGKGLLDFEIGNEPDCYPPGGVDLWQFNFGEFTNRWLSNYSVIMDRIPGARFSGPAAAFNFWGYTMPFAREFGNRIELLTQHYYLADGKQKPYPDIDRLLSSLGMGFDLRKLQWELESVRKAASRYVSGGYRLAEANSFYHGGSLGVSNKFGSALWALEFCFLLAQYGSSGVNFHGGGSSPGYTPIANDNEGRVTQVRAEYYGILLFSLAGRGSLLQVKKSVTLPFFFIYAISLNDGTLSLILANNSRNETVDASLKLPESYSNATSMVLTADSLDATNGMTLGGSSVIADGTWEPLPARELPLEFSGRSLSMRVHPVSAVLIRCMPERRLRDDLSGCIIKGCKLQTSAHSEFP